MSKLKPINDLVPEIIKFDTNESLEIYKNQLSKEIKTKTQKEINKNEIVFLIIPGGAYSRVGWREGYPVANKFLTYGYSCAILKYRIGRNCYPTNYNEGIKSIEILNTKFKHIILMGFSAGGHLAGFLGTDDRKNLPKVIAMVLSYPVISFERNTHEETRDNFLGDNYNNDEYKKKFSIDQRVSKDTLPTFIWTTKTDELVPCQNTLDMIEKLKQFGVKYESKIFENGIHGLALGDMTTLRDGDMNFFNQDVQQWVDLANKFLEEVIMDL